METRTALAGMAERSGILTVPIQYPPYWLIPGSTVDHGVAALEFRFTSTLSTSRSSGRRPRPRLVIASLAVYFKKLAARFEGTISNESARA